MWVRVQIWPNFNMCILLCSGFIWWASQLVHTFLPAFLCSRRLKKLEERAFLGLSLRSKLILGYQGGKCHSIKRSLSYSCSGAKIKFDFSQNSPAKLICWSSHFYFFFYFSLCRSVSFAPWFIIFCPFSQQIYIIVVITLITLTILLAGTICQV